MIDFYYAPDTCSLATHIVLREVGAEFRPHRIDFSMREQQGSAYARINPKMRVPAMVTPEGVLTETPAMLGYLAAVHPEAGLLPVDPWAAAQVHAFCAYLCATLHVAHAHRMRGHRWADDPAAWDAMQRKVPESVGGCWRHIEENAFTGPFVFGETYTIADPYMFTLAQWIEPDGVNPATVPKVAAHRAMMAARQTVQDALAAETA